MFYFMPEKKVSKVESILEKMSESRQVFLLTGSRYFGNNHISSDYDFFTEDSVSIRIFLETLGFKLISDIDVYPHDGQVLDVYRYEQPFKYETSNCAQSIDVQMVKDVQIKVSAQTFLVRAGHKPSSSDRDMAKLAWKLAYQAAKELAN